MFLIIFIITVLILSIFLGVYTYVWSARNAKESNSSLKGSRVYKLDINNRKILDYFIHYYHINSEFNYSNDKKWESLDERIIDSFDDKDVNLKFNNAIHKLENGAKHDVFTFEHVSRTFHKKLLLFKCEFNAVQDDADYFLKITWKPKWIHEAGQQNGYLMKRTEVIDNPKIYKGFIAFNVNSEASDVEFKLLNIASRFINQPIFYFKTSNFVIFTFFENKAKKIKNQIEKFVKNMRAIGFRKGVNHLFDGSACATSTKINSMRALNQLIQTLDFLINISIESKNNFISHENSLDKNEFRKFVQASKSYRLAARSGNINSLILPVRSLKTKRRKIGYAIPVIKSINESLLSKIIRNKNNKNFLVNAHAKMIAIDQKITKPVLLDVNSEWLAINADNINYKKAIYVINLNQNHPSEEIRETVKKLSINNFIFALRINSYNEEIATFIKNINISFIVIDELFWNENKIAFSDALINLMTIKKIAQAKNLKLIYENPSDFIDKKMIEKIDLDFFFNK